MSTDEWQQVRSAESMDEKIRALADVARARAERRNDDVEDVVHVLAHNEYLARHTVSDVLREPQELSEMYTDAFYDGGVNDYLLESLDTGKDPDFWYGYLYTFLAAGVNGRSSKSFREGSGGYCSIWRIA